ncbi:MAG: hypothetical protein NTY13_00750 [Chlamydiae bacterium]|nr:hypothetical protein [Chlamydiota bacterium]
MKQSFWESFKASLSFYLFHQVRSCASLQQRTLTGDDITTPPFVPVLLQVMFAEEKKE